MIDVAAVRDFGIEPVLCEPDTQSRQAKAEELRQQTGATMVHPYDCEPVMAGQGTVALEIYQQVPNVDVLIVPVGGGGLLSGMLIAAKTIDPDIAVIGAEPAYADDASRSIESGQRLMPTRYDTVADGLRTALGDLTFPIIRHHVDSITLVSEQEILSATRDLAERVHLVAEPSGAVAYACVRKIADRLEGKRVVVVISGGNVDFKDCGLGNGSE